MKVIGVDPGSIITGYGIISAGERKIKAVKYGVIKPSSDLPFHSRLKFIYDEITKIIKKHKPTELAIETAFYGKNFQSVFKIGHVRGVIILSAVNYGLPVYEYTPREIKKAVVGRGNATKEQVNYMVRSLLELESFPEFLDVSDALAVAICHVNRTLIPVKARYRDWKAFIKAHPELVENQTKEQNKK